jgi:hypothetical protein
MGFNQKYWKLIHREYCHTSYRIVLKRVMTPVGSVASINMMDLHVKNWTAVVKQ